MRAAKLLEHKEGIPGKAARKQIHADLEAMQVDKQEAANFTKYMVEQARAKEKASTLSGIPLGAKTQRLASAIAPLKDVRVPQGMEDMLKVVDAIGNMGI
eukprot:22986-Amphidinium_carterae.1